MGDAVKVILCNTGVATHSCAEGRTRADNLDITNSYTVAASMRELFPRVLVTRKINHRTNIVCALDSFLASRNAALLLFSTLYFKHNGK